MKLPDLLPSVAAGLAMFATTGCISVFRSEGDPFTSFQPSPNGQYVVSLVHSGIEIPIPTEGVDLSASVAVRFRNSMGKTIFTVPVATARQQGEIDYGHVSTVWSPDSKALAYCSKGNLFVVGIEDRKPRKLLQSISSFRWDGNSNLCCVMMPPANDAFFSGMLSIVDMPIYGGPGKTNKTSLKAYSFSSITEDRPIELSPDLKNLFFADTKTNLILSLQNPNIQHALQRKIQPDYCRWTDTGDRCLIYGRETLKTSKPWPDDTTWHFLVYLYDTNSAVFTELPIGCSGSQDRVWSPDGRWFLSSLDTSSATNSVGLARWNCICVPKPWQSVCVQEIAGKAYHSPKIAPTGSKIGIMNSTNEFLGSGDLYVIDVQVGTDGKPDLTQPRKVGTNVRVNTWFWSADGQQLLVWNGWNNFKSYPVNEIQQEKRP